VYALYKSTFYLNMTTLRSGLFFVRFVRSTQPVEIFGNVSTQF